jgi:thioesterase domain-containing protein
VSPAELQDYLRTRIPLAQAMGVEVRGVGDDGVELFAPLAPNTNHRDTVFGGSASAVAILAAWSVLHVRMRSAGVEGRIVIHSNTMQYERPIVAGVTATLSCQGEQVGRLEAQFAVVPPGAT